MTALLTLGACGGETGDPSSMLGHSGGAGGSAQMPAAGAGQDERGGSSGSAGTPGAGGATEAGTGAGGATSGSAHGGGGTAGSAGMGGQGGMLTTPEALVPVASAFCAAAQSCCAKEQLPSNLGDCESGYASRDETAQALARGTVTLDSAGLARCLAAYQSAAESCEELGVLEACRGVVQGTRAEGESCLVGSECAGSDAKACLVPDGEPGTLGVCKSILHGKQGEACEITCRPDENCTWTSIGAAPDQAPKICFEADGFFCDFNDEPTCQPIRTVGTACTDSDECGSAGECDYDTHLCRALGQLNDPCGSCISQLSCIDGTCQSPSFTVGPTCDGVSFGPY